MPQTPKPEKKCNPQNSTKDSYISLTAGFALGPAYWATLSFASDNSVYLSLNQGSGGGARMLGAAFGIIPQGTASSVLTGPGGSAAGGWILGGSVQGGNGGYAVDFGLTTPGGAVGMGYGFKIYDGNAAQRNPQVFRDSDGKTLERCY